jgi:hypothetical protein
VTGFLKPKAFADAGLGPAWFFDICIQGRKCKILQL